MYGILRCILSVRYDVQIKGLKEVKKRLNKKKGIFFLPSHPAEIDPPMLTSYLTGFKHPKPLVVEHFFYLKGVSFFMNFAGAIPIPNFETTVNEWKKKKLDKVLEQMHEVLDQGENILVYPAGHLKRKSKEVIGGSSFTYNVIEKNRDANIVLVRTTGLWGSSFSRALDGKLPDFWGGIARGIKIVLKNGIFFVPKRKVIIEFAIAPKEITQASSKMEMNKLLEKWYNQYPKEEGSKDIVDKEPVKLVSYSCFKKELPQVTFQEDKVQSTQDVKVPFKVQEDVYLHLAKLAKTTSDKISQSMDLSIDLGLDSLDVATLIAYLDQRYELPKVTPSEFATVADILVVLSQKGAKKRGNMHMPPFSWGNEDRPVLDIPKGSTLVEAFFNSSDRLKNHICAADNNSGKITYKRWEIGAILLAEKIAKLPGEYVGIMLPSSIGSYITTLACLIAKKIPVMLNWTAGSRNIEHGVKELSIESIITSQKFLDRLAYLEIGDAIEKLILLEDVRRSITLSDKLSAMFLSKRNVKAKLKKLGLTNQKKEDTAVVLFTSGTENFPKAVPLSHHNILSNLRSVQHDTSLKPSDILYASLPPFHSFGFTVTGFFPILYGIRAFFAPDPTDAQAIAEDVKRVQATIICLAPSFYQNLFQIAEKDDLKSIRLLVTGAEKASESLLAYASKNLPQAEMIEGYGITECSPIVTIQREGDVKKGVGKPIGNIEICTIHLETLEKLPKGETGEICIHGDSVFSGYLGEGKKDPFIELDGKRWYRSGDLGFLDEDNNLILSGRLKRFVKIGGEMISLHSIEEVLTKEVINRKLFQVPEDKAFLSVCAQQKENEKPLLHLFCIAPLEKDMVNDILQENQFARIVKINQVHEINEIPTNAAGKISYKALDEQMKTSDV